jgi:hypothetical protein
MRADATRLLLALIHDCQAVLAEYLPRDGISAVEALNRLLWMLDGPRSREAEVAIEGGEQPPPAA